MSHFGWEGGLPTERRGPFSRPRHIPIVDVLWARLMPNAEPAVMATFARSDILGHLHARCCDVPFRCVVREMRPHRCLPLVAEHDYAWLMSLFACLCYVCVLCRLLAQPEPHEVPSLMSWQMKLNEMWGRLLSAASPHQFPQSRPPNQGSTWAHEPGLHMNIVSVGPHFSHCISHLGF